MDFEYIPKTMAQKRFEYYIDNNDAFYKFVEEFNIVGVHWNQPTNISASYFLRLLTEGAKEKPRGYGRGFNNKSDTASQDLDTFYLPLFDHGVLWRQSGGSVICTAMPYGTPESIIDSFMKMTSEYGYPSTVKIDFLDDSYRFRPNGNFMILIYSDCSQDEFNESLSDEEIYRKAVQYSRHRAPTTQSVVNSYSRNRYISEFAKRRANGICQLCGKPAPFIDQKGRPYLETHHIEWLADGGADSIENTVALCPNCHRKMHTLNLPEDVERLKHIISDNPVF